MHDPLLAGTEWIAPTRLCVVAEEAHTIDGRDASCQLRLEHDPRAGSALGAAVTVAGGFAFTFATNSSLPRAVAEPARSARPVGDAAIAIVSH